MSKKHGYHRVDLKLNGSSATTIIPDGMKLAHGVGLNGFSQTHSLKVGTSPHFAKKVFVEDTHGNTILTTPDELLAALRTAAPEYEITARFRNTRRRPHS